MRRRVIQAVILLLFIWMVASFYGAKGRMPLPEAFVRELAQELTDAVYVQFLPGVKGQAKEDYASWVAQAQIETIMPLYGMAVRDGDYLQGASAMRGDEGQSRVLAYEDFAQTQGGSAATQPVLAGQEAFLDGELQALLQEENQAAQLSKTRFVPHSRKLQLKLEDYTDYETLVKTFYTIDTNTMAGSDQLNLEALLSRDMTMEKDGENPQILIYHTHSQECFADSTPGDAGTSVVGVGEELARILREQYGYQVLHHTGEYDVDTRDDAYAKSLPALEALLKKYPSIQVVIDLHRDQMPEQNRLVMNLDGRPTARFMFFNGLSRTRQSGDITYLKNENISDNLAFSFQMQLKCEEYYPGLTRKIYLKGYRYNMHLCPKSLLVELGAQNNTVEEAMNACGPLAHVLDMVLGGEER